MMRPMVLQVPPGQPIGVTAQATTILDPVTELPVPVAQVSFTLPLALTGGGTPFYTVVSNPGGIISSGTVSPITISSLTIGTSYTFTVTASNYAGTGPTSAPSNAITWAGVPGANAVGESIPSAPSNIIIPGQAPRRPTGLKAITTAASYALLNWTDNADNEQGFTVERSANGGVTWTQIGGTGANTAFFRANGLTARTRYLFRAQAFNGNGVSTYSNVLTVTTR